MGPKARKEKAEKAKPPMKKEVKSGGWNKPKAETGPPRKPARIVMPNSLEANIGVEGYDDEGVRTLRALQGRYNLPEVWRTLKLWMAKNECDLLMEMWIDPAHEGYNRYDQEIEVIEEQYNNSAFYRRQMDELVKTKNKLHPLVKKQEAKVMSKLESLVDMPLLQRLMQDADYEGIVNVDRRPHFYRALIVQAVNAGVGVGPRQAKENLRAEWVDWEMEYADEPLPNYRLRFNDLIARSTASGVVYSQAEKANKFIMGCSGKWAEKQAQVEAKAEEDQPQTLDEAQVELSRYENAQISAYGSFHSATPLGQQYAVFRVGKAGARRENGTRGDASPVEESGYERSNDMRWTADGLPICARCGGRGHKVASCPSPASIGAVCLVASVRADARRVMLDDGAEVSLFCSSQLVDAGD